MTKKNGILECIEINRTYVPLKQYNQVCEVLAKIDDLINTSVPRDLTMKQWNTIRKFQKAFEAYANERDMRLNDPFK